MEFPQLKQKILQRQDRSKKGVMDEKITALCKKINQHPNFITTSSCSGRIVVLQLPKKGKKKDAQFLFQSHTLVKTQRIKNELEGYVGKDPLIFKEEGPILHIAARTLDDAENLIRLGQHSGFKRSTIITVKKKIVVELRSMEQLEAPIFDKHLLITDEYLACLVKCANEKLRKGWKQIHKLEEAWLKQQRKR